MGKACVEKLSARGHKVYGTVYGIDMDPEWKKLPYTLLPCDVTDPARVERAVAIVHISRCRYLSMIHLSA